MYYKIRPDISVAFDFFFFSMISRDWSIKLFSLTSSVGNLHFVARYVALTFIKKQIKFQRGSTKAKIDNLPVDLSMLLVINDCKNVFPDSAVSISFECYLPEKAFDFSFLPSKMML